MKKLIVFDLDGTLLDTSTGIIHCYRKAGQALNLVPNNVENEKFVIGGPLSHGFEYLYQMESEEQVQNAVDIYRSTYQTEGINMFVAYQDIDKMLEALKGNGYMLAVATLKLESYAKQMLKAAGIANYFDIIHGWDGTEKCTKAFILTKVLYSLNTITTDALLVGDSDYDAKGADATGIDFLGVTYGFGIHKNDSTKTRPAYPLADSPDDVLDYIINS